MPSPAVRRATINRLHQQLTPFRARAAAALVTAWDVLGSHRGADIDRYSRQVAAPLAGAKAAAVATSVAAYALLLGIRPVSVAAAKVPVAADLRRPFTAAWHVLQVGRPWSEAFEVGRSVAEAVGFDFVQHASRQTGDLVAEASGREVRWERVPGGNACEWCLSVAGPHYESAESADFGHERCDCVAVPA